MTSKIVCLLCAAASLVVGCGGSPGTDPDEKKSDLSAAAPLLAISSPVARKNTSASGVGQLRQALDANPNAPAAQLKGYAEQLGDIQNRLKNATKEADCFAGIQFSAQDVQVSCYGPSLYFLNHPDYVSGPNGPTGNCPITGDGNGCLPGGDLGIWSPTQGAEGEACVAAKMNAQVQSVGSAINNNIGLMVGMLCAAQLQSKEMPAIGQSLDLVDSLKTNLPGSSFSVAAVERVADKSNGQPQYKISVEGQVSGFELNTTLTHSPASDGSAFEGNLHGYLDFSFGGGEVRRGFSIVYKLSDKVLKYELRAATTPTTASAGDLFNDGIYQFDVFTQQGGSPSYSNANYGRSEVSVTTGLGTLYHAWQAGGMDGFTRVFQAHTQAQSGGPDKGFGYFGFGPAVSSAEVGAIQGMWCNWAGPGNRPSGPSHFNSSKVQAQTMLRDATSGVFKPELNHILYAPTNSCDVSASADFRYSTTEDSNAGLTNNVAAADVANTLVPLNDSSIGQVPDVTPPTF